MRQSHRACHRMISAIAGGVLSHTHHGGSLRPCVCAAGSKVNGDEPIRVTSRHCWTTSKSSVPAPNSAHRLHLSKNIQKSLSPDASQGFQVLFSRMFSTEASPATSELETLLHRQKERCPQIVQELQAHGRKVSHWAWWVFPTEKAGASEPVPKTCVTRATAPMLLRRAPPEWRQALETICALVEANGGDLGAVLPHIDHPRVKKFVEFWGGVPADNDDAEDSSKPPAEVGVAVMAGADGAWLLSVCRILSRSLGSESCASAPESGETTTEGASGGVAAQQQTGLEPASDSGAEAGLQGEIPGVKSSGQRLVIVFTCTKCGTRSMKKISGNSYENGVVIVRCPGCQSLHLIADRLGYFESGGAGDKPGWDVEQHLQETGGNFKRVSENEDGNEVYELTAEDLAGGPILTK